MNLKEKDLDKVPEFYTSLTNNPLTDIIGGGQSVYDGIIKLIKFQDVTVTVAGSGTTVVHEPHNIKGEVPLVYIYTQTFAETIIIPNSKQDKTHFGCTVINYNLGARTITFRAYFYRFITKNPK